MRDDTFIQMIEKAEANVRRDLAWQTEYRHYVARMSGIREQGLEDCRQEAIQRGYAEGIRKSIRRLLANHIPAEEVKRLLNVTDEDIQMAQKK